MKLSDLIENKILPFEIEDEKLKKLFSFFLHSAPTVASVSAAVLSVERLDKNWNNFISRFTDNSYIFIQSQCSIEKYFEKYSLHTDADIKRQSHGFICKRRDKTEEDYVCFLRHIRNAIAHSHVYCVHVGNRKFILFEDFNTKTTKQSSRILLSQTDLQRLKNEIMK